MNAFLVASAVGPSGKHGRADCCLKSFAWGVAAVTTFWITAPTALAEAPTPGSQGEAIFRAACAGCHLGGGNVIPYARGKTLKLKALEKNKVDTMEAIVALSKSGKGAMPKYEGKLDDAELEAVARFILDQAKEGWR